MDGKITIAIADGHQSVIDGYLYRLEHNSQIKVIGSANCGDQIEKILSIEPIKILLTEINIRISPENQSPYPILYFLPQILKKYPDLKVLIISTNSAENLIHSLIDLGISGYINKYDHSSIVELPNIVRMIANGGTYFSKGIFKRSFSSPRSNSDRILTTRQMEVLSLLASDPDCSTTELAERLGVAGSTIRNLLSGVYSRLGVRTRAAAILQGQQLGLIGNTDFNHLKR